jgi:hypothetical protein
MSDPTVASQTDYKAAQGGSSSIQIALETAEMAAEAWGVPSGHPLATPGWHEISPALTGGSIGRDRNVTKIRLENDVEYVELTNEDSILVTNTTIVVDPLRFNLIEWMEDHYFKLRYALPTRPDGGYKTQELDTTNAISGPVAHYWMFPRVSASKENWSMAVENGSLREVQFVLDASRPKQSSEQRIYFQEILPMDTSITVAEADRTLRADWGDAPYSDYADSAITTP